MAGDPSGRTDGGSIRNVDSALLALLSTSREPRGANVDMPGHTLAPPSQPHGRVGVNPLLFARMRPTRPGLVPQVEPVGVAARQTTVQRIPRPLPMFRMATPCSPFRHGSVCQHVASLAATTPGPASVEYAAWQTIFTRMASCGASRSAGIGDDWLDAVVAGLADQDMDGALMRMAPTIRWSTQLRPWLTSLSRANRTLVSDRLNRSCFLGLFASMATSDAATDVYVRAVSAKVAATLGQPPSFALPSPLLAQCLVLLAAELARIVQGPR